jgi:hypothetical protein
MPQLRFPKRDTEGLNPEIADNSLRTYMFLPPSSNASYGVSYATPKHVYAIIILAVDDPHSGYPNTPLYHRLPTRMIKLEITEDGSSFYRVPTYITDTNITTAYFNVYWWINKPIKGWRLINTSSSVPFMIFEVIVLVPDDTQPYLPVYLPQTISIISDGTTNLEGVTNLFSIIDGDDNTYASFIFRSGFYTYTLYLEGKLSVPMLSVVSPFALIEIDPGSSNIRSAIDDLVSHGYFHWGLKDSITSDGPFFGGKVFFASIERVENSPRLRWSQKIYETVLPPGDYPQVIVGSPTDDHLRPDNYIFPYRYILGGNTPVSGPALLEALTPSIAINSKYLYVPYFFSFYHRPVFIAIPADNFIKYTTYDLNEPLAYVAANEATNQIYLKFGLHIEGAIRITGGFTVRIYALGFLCYPQMDLLAPYTLGGTDYAAWPDLIPVTNVTRDKNLTTETPDLEDRRFISIYPAATNVSLNGGTTIRLFIRSTGTEPADFTISRFYGYHVAADDQIVWYLDSKSYNVGPELQPFDISGEDRFLRTNLIKFIVWR